MILGKEAGTIKPKCEVSALGSFSLAWSLVRIHAGTTSKNSRIGRESLDDHHVVHMK